MCAVPPSIRLSERNFRTTAPVEQRAVGPSVALGRIRGDRYGGNEGCRIVDADCKAIGTALDAERAVDRRPRLLSLERLWAPYFNNA